MEGTLNSGMCRCCASEGTFKDVSSKYHWMGEEEVYADMLRECFDITLVSAEEGQEGGICEVCITQLRNASNFKKQVQQTEEQFKKRLNDNLFKNNIIKVELAGLEEDDHHSENNDNNLSDGLSGPEYEVPIKAESEETKGKKRTRSSTARTKKPKVENAESSKNKRVSRRKGRSGSCEETERLTLNKKLNFSTFIAIKPAGVSSKSSHRTPTKSPPPIQIEPVQNSSEKPSTRKAPRARPPEKVIQRRLTELDLHYDNIKTVLRCSNATPIRCKVGSRYACSYCLDQFEDPRDLKAHTIDTHSDTGDKPDCLCIRSLSKYCVHLDVTDLKCELCDGGMDMLEDLIDHLKLEHDELIHTNIRNLMVPYKFETTEVKCVLCLKNFDDYLDLQEHMSDHYKNYVCEFCDKAFLLRSTMIEHKKVVHRV